MQIIKSVEAWPLVDPLQPGLEAFPIVDIDLSGGLDQCNLRLREFFHDLAGRAHDEGAVWDGLAFRDEGVGADDAMLADDGFVHDSGADADQALVADGAAVEHGHVTDGDVFADGERAADISVKDRAVLYV